MTYEVETTSEQEAALSALVALRNAERVTEDEPEVTAAGLIREWALHPLNARLHDARVRAVRAEAIDATVAALTSDDPALRADAEALQAQLADLASRVRAQHDVKGRLRK